MSNHALRTALAAVLSLALSESAAADVWINEIHYDNTGTDTGEAVEIAGAAGTSLAGWSLLLYNGADGKVYASHGLSGSLPATCGAFGVVTVNTPDIQNGSPDGLALVDGAGKLVQFLSYEGRIRGKDGAARNVQSQDIGVQETVDTPIGYSLQLAGTGSGYADFVWTSPFAASFGQCNADQTFPGMDQPPAVASTSPANGASNVPASASIGIVFSEPVTVLTDWASIDCDASGNHGYSVSGGPTSFILQPTVAFDSLESCAVRVLADRVFDNDGNPDPMLADHVFAFGTEVVSTDYYAGVDARSPTMLRVTLHETIDDHQRYPYTSTATDTWDILEFADEDPLASGRILDVYKNASYAKAGGGNTEYNREHTWPKSYGFPTDGSANYPYTDTHMLFLADASYNSSRSNKPYADCTGTCTEKVTLSNGGVGGGSGVFPGFSNWANSTFWQTWSDRKGDVARAVLYMDVRYEGGTHGVTGAAEPDLILTDDPGLIATTGSNASLAYMGLLADVLRWHAEDPVDEKERLRNEAVFSFQGNRNPFIDHPEWVTCLYQNQCP
jgi:endonuclease I